MGFKQPNINLALVEIRKSFIEINSTYNDGFVQRSCKQELYMLKCWLEDEYKQLPTFVGEEQWEQKRLVEILKK